MMFIPGTYDLMIEYLNEGVMYARSFRCKLRAD